MGRPTCYTGCSVGCVRGCEYTCTGYCTNSCIDNCGKYCSGDCGSSCGEDCDSSCESTCVNGCGTSSIGNTMSLVETWLNQLTNLNTLITASDINNLIKIVQNELNRRPSIKDRVSMSSAANGNIIIYKVLTDIYTNLYKMGKTKLSPAVSGGVCSKEFIKSYIVAAKELYYSFAEKNT